ncbi:MAG: AAA family ATPase, partial [Lachnospiraceae bacterium]|nr:AAA family ATPase [Lachnospiraceae bacterium]
MAKKSTQSKKAVTPFVSYDEYMKHIFDCVNRCLSDYLEGMKSTFSNGQGGYKNVLYPDLEIASDSALEQVSRFERDMAAEKEDTDEDSSMSGMFGSDEEDDEEYNELAALLGAFSTNDSDTVKEKEKEKEEDGKSREEKTGGAPSVADRIEKIQLRAKAAFEEGVEMPFYELCEKMDFDPFTIFCFACGILSSTQTDYAGIFQIVNENGSLPAPTIESAGRLYYGDTYSITGAYGDMSVCLEQLLPVLDLRVVPSMPFSTAVSPDKRIIDFLFGKDRMKLDENYSRFIKMLTNDEELDPILANEGQLEAMKISYGEGVRIFSYFGDEGSGRKFFIRNFCKEKNMRAISMDCKKLFIYDFSFVEKALWAITRECILTNSCCVLDELTFREDEKEKFYGYMDLAFSKLTAKGILVFCISKLQLAMRDITKDDFTELEIPTPTNLERIKCWEFFSKDYKLEPDVDMKEMATKFLFTCGKIKGALRTARSLATMDKEILITRDKLFKGCYAQMSSELTQKATKIKANFGFSDIVMSPDQREAIERAIAQMTYRQNVYEGWDYNKKYPYGRGLSVLLFGAPGTGKSMCAQVIAHELNLELYRVDLSKVIDKYVGETEKSISMIFREAKKCNVVLFFDECDTLFAKRADDGGSNQASANNKTALLLQEVEGYDGVSVLATNYKHNI